MSEDNIHSHVSPLTAGLKGRCPPCGKDNLYNGFLELADRCDVCALDYAFADAGDGPAVFVVLFLGFIICGLALWTELTFQPSYWVHLTLWLPLTLLLAVGLLRPMKATMVALQYKNKAREGRLTR